MLGGNLPGLSFRDGHAKKLAPKLSSEANNAPKGKTHFDPIHAFPPFPSFLICHTSDHQFPLISIFISCEVTYEEEDLGLMGHFFYGRLAIEI